MKPSRFLVPMLVAGGVMGLPAGSQADDLTPQNASGSVPTTQPSARSGVLIQAIRQAPDPSAAIQAYADARAGEPNNREVQRAYVQRMVELGLPEMAGTQAQDLLRHDGEDGQAWAVAAYIAAKRDDRSLAVYDAAQATRFAPDDPFVMRTAGQVVAWYDTRDNLLGDEGTRSSVETIRQRLAGQQGYAEAYGNAVAAYKRLAQGGTSEATTSPASTAVQTETAPASMTYAGPVYEPETPAYNSYAYYSPSYPAGPSYPYWWPDYGFGASWWWPSFSSVVIIDDDFHRHHHDFDFIRDHHHDFDDPRFFHHDGDFSRHDHDHFADARFHGHDGDFFGNGRHDFGGAGFVGHHDDIHAMTAAGHLDAAPVRGPTAWRAMSAASSAPRQISTASVHGGIPWGATMTQGRPGPQRIEGGSFHSGRTWSGGSLAAPAMAARSAPAAPAFAAGNMHANAPMSPMPTAAMRGGPLAGGAGQFGAMPAGAAMGGMHGGGRGGGGHR